MKLSKKIKELKEKVMLDIHNKPIDISLGELQKHNKRIDEAIEQVKKGESIIKNTLSCDSCGKNKQLIKIDTGGGIIRICKQCLKSYKNGK